MVVQGEADGVRAGQDRPPRALEGRYFLRLPGLRALERITSQVPGDAVHAQRDGPLERSNDLTGVVEHLDLDLRSLLPVVGSAHRRVRGMLRVCDVCLESGFLCHRLEARGGQLR